MRAEDELAAMPLPSAHDVTLAGIGTLTDRRSWHDARVRWAIAKQTRDLRKSRGWTRAELARRTGCGPMSIYRVENVRYSIGMSILVQIAKAFDCALEGRFATWGDWLEAQRQVEGGTLPPSFDEEVRSEKRA